MKINTITEDDISFTERLLLPCGNTFDEYERIPIIRNFTESLDVIACPGSGKTTALLAKLVILSRKMPFNDGQGICVLTHTNVAINEIKNKLKDNSAILFKYPNFFGTIDSFINKFLTMPFYKNIMKKELTSIDTNAYNEELERLIRIEFPNIDNEINIKLRAGFKRCKIFIRNENVEVDNSMIMSDYYDAVRESVNRMVVKIFNKGIISHKQAFYLALDYIKHYPILKDYFQKRFKLVFIDEMQDTKMYQENVLKEIFKKEACTIQRFGDLNQNIGSGEGDDVCGWELKLENLKEINSTKRYGSQISRYLENLRIAREGKLIGNTEITSYKPHIIIFDNKCITKVEEVFIELIKRYKLYKSNRRVFKAIGFISQNPKNENELTIKSYNPNYIKKNANSKISFVEKILNNCFQSQYPHTLYSDLIELILNILRNDGRNYSSNKIIEELSTKAPDIYNEFRLKVTNWHISIFDKTEEVLNEIKITLLKLLKLINPMTDEKVLDQHLKSSNIDILKQVATTKVSKNDEDNIVVEYETIHNVKGETHTATLYLESKYRNWSGDLSDISKIIDFLVCENVEGDDISPDIKKSLGLAYVAMSRATHLVCIAISYDTIKGRMKSFVENEYELIAASKEIEDKINGEIN